LQNALFSTLLITITTLFNYLFSGSHLQHFSLKNEPATMKGNTYWLLDID
jgi:hypothetical protein